MKFLGLVLKSARRSKRRTALTVLSVAIAVFLFASLRAVLDGFNAGAEASSSTRIVTHPLDVADLLDADQPRRDDPDGARRARLTWANWFGGIYKDPGTSSRSSPSSLRATCGCIPEIILTPDERKAFLDDRTGCIVGDGLAKTYGFKVGDKIVAAGRHSDLRPAGLRLHDPRHLRTGGAPVDNQSMLFHWKYADERSVVKGQAGWYVMQIANPDQAAQVSAAIDQKFANSPYETKTDTERAFQSSFVSMFGNLNLLLGSIARRRS